MIINDKTQGKLMRVQDMPHGVWFKATLGKDSTLYRKLNPSSLGNITLKWANNNGGAQWDATTLGDGCLVMRIADGSVFVMTSETTGTIVDVEINVLNFVQ